MPFCKNEDCDGGCVHLFLIGLFHLPRASGILVIQFSIRQTEFGFFWRRTPHLFTILSRVWKKRHFEFKPSEIVSESALGLKSFSHQLFFPFATNTSSLLQGFFSPTVWRDMKTAASCFYQNVVITLLCFTYLVNKRLFKEIKPLFFQGRYS